jgi:hypothetical protein
MKIYLCIERFDAVEWDLAFCSPRAIFSKREEAIKYGERTFWGVINKDWFVYEYEVDKYATSNS